MCKSPTPTWIYRGESAYEEVLLPCGKCDHCAWRGVNDYVGRSLAEAYTATKTYAVTLTYADRQHDNWHKVLYPPHFQDFIRSLRRRGHLVRYLASGEYGSLRGRAHFHACLFFHDPDPPQWGHNQRVHDPAWGPRDGSFHGHMHVIEGIEDHHLRYAIKYLQKDRAKGNWFSLSKKPVLGWPFFEQKAHQLFESRLMPTSWRYAPPDGVGGFSYGLSGATRRDYLLLLNDLYEAGGVQMPAMNEYVSDQLDKALRWRLAKTEDIKSPSELWSDMMRGIRDGAAAQARHDRNCS